MEFITPIRKQKITLCRKFRSVLKSVKFPSFEFFEVLKISNISDAMNGHFEKKTENKTQIQFDNTWNYQLAQEAPQRCKCNIVRRRWVRNSSKWNGWKFQET